MPIKRSPQTMLLRQRADELTILQSKRKMRNFASGNSWIYACTPWGKTSAFVVDCFDTKRKWKCVDANVRARACPCQATRHRRFNVAQEFGTLKRKSLVCLITPHTPSSSNPLHSRPPKNTRATKSNVAKHRLTLNIPWPQRQSSL